ncbi:MAG: MptD family putative ECF transporter S component [Oscillospiraceae bacterium]|nr:MptD family putative ECF transporter S component [Oscillospiraceae bacterium]
MKPTNKLTVPDLISIGVFTALYFVLVTIATFSSAALFPGFNNVVLPAVCALISGSVYMLLAAKLQKFGGISVMGIVMGMFFMTSGHFIVSFAANIVMGIVADFVAKAGSYKSRKGLLFSYVLFSYGLFGPVLPMWFMKDAYVANLEARGKDAVYIAELFANINMGTFVFAVVATLVCALIGGWFGQKMIKKHFVKAGIV